MVGGPLHLNGHADTLFGMFYDWKMSGSYYNDYAGAGVSSRLSKVP